jgi:hypothetical protein
MDNPEKLTTLGTQDEEQQSKNTTQYVLDTDVFFCLSLPRPLPDLTIYKKQELLTLRGHLSSPPVFWWGPCCPSL